MILSVDGFTRLLQGHVVEGLFSRRHEKLGWPMGRRILCTLDRNLLTSLPGRMSLNFRNPIHPPPYVARAYNLVVAWDIFWQDWRAIPVDALNIISALPTHTKKDQEKFWQVFSGRMQQMTPNEKNEFMKNHKSLYLTYDNIPLSKTPKG